MGSYLMYVDKTVDEKGVVYYRDSDNAGIKGERVVHDDLKRTPDFKFKPDDYLVVRNVRTDEPIVVKGDVLQAAIDKAEDDLKHMSKEQMAEAFMTLNDVLKNEYMKSWIGSPKWGDVGYGHNHDTVILNVWKDVSDKGRVAIRTSDNHNLRPFTGKIHRGMVVVGNEYVVPEKDNLVIRDVVTGEPETISVRELTESCESRYMHDCYWDKADENSMPSMNRDLGSVIAKSNKEILHEHTNYNLPKRSHESVRDFADVTAAGDDNFQKGFGE